MKEHPILFNTENVKAILDGIKTQTRRVLKPQPDSGLDPFDGYAHIEVGNYHPTMIDKNGEEYPGDEIFGAYTDDGEWGWKCPYGQVGDRLWVRETWAYSAKNQQPDGVIYKADGTILPNALARGTYTASQGWGKWSPSIFMPRCASRITLEITEVRVERVQEISEEDAFSEGLRNKVYSNFDPDFDIAIYSAREAFHNLWDTLNEKRGYGWLANPWVWPLSFRRLDGKA